jgi:transcriptional regulator GlxA family with amidase domain
MSSVPPQRPTRTIALLIGHGSNAMDVTAMAAAFTHANQCDEAPRYQVLMIGAGEYEVSSEGIAFATQPAHQFRAAVDTLVVTGAAAPDPDSPPLRTWLTAQFCAARRWCAIDLGVLALAGLGLASHRRMAARPGTQAALPLSLPHLTIDETSLYLRDGHLWSCPGGTAVIDMALAMIEEDCGQPVADAVAQRMQIPARRSGARSQLGPALHAQGSRRRDRQIAQLVDWIHANPARSLSVPALAARAAMSERTLHRRFKAFSGVPPQDYIVRIRLERAHQLLFDGMSMKAAAARAGFASSTALTRALRRAPPSATPGSADGAARP